MANDWMMDALLDESSASAASTGMSDWDEELGENEQQQTEKCTTTAKTCGLFKKELGVVRLEQKVVGEDTWLHGFNATDQLVGVRLISSFV
jgi:hypothetical protein